MSNCAEYAVLVGASMSGLLYATVLAGYYNNVTAVERDVLPVGSENRRGGPQGTHVHVLMPRGSQTLGELFPDFSMTSLPMASPFGTTEIFRSSAYRSGECPYPALHDRGCSWGLNPPVSSSDRAM